VSIDKIKNALIADAQADADRIVRAARREAERQLARAGRELQEQHQRQQRDLRAQLDAHRTLELLRARSANSQELLARKNEIIKGIFQAAAQQFEQLPQEQYLAVLERWLAKIDPHAGGQIMANPRDLALLRERVLPQVNARRAPEAALHAAAEPIDVRAGFIFRSARFELDHTLDARLRRLQEELSVEIAAELFKSPDGEKD